MENDWHVAFISILAAALAGLIGLVYRNLNARVENKLGKDSHDELVKLVEGKMDTQLYKETMVHIQKAVDGINGTAQTLRSLAKDITEIQDKFMTSKDFQYELRLHHSECPAVQEMARMLNKLKEEEK